MKIDPINFYNRLTFKSTDINKYLYDFDDDENSEEKYDDWGIPSYDPRITEALRNSILAKIPKQPEIDTDYEQTYRQFFPTEIRSIGNNSYRGETLAYTPQRLDIMRDKGVKLIIDLVGLKIADYQNTCQKHHLEYYYPQMFFNYYDNPAFKTPEEYNRVIDINRRYGIDTSNFDYEKNSRKFIEEFKQFVKILNKGNFYIGCNHGVEITNFVLLMNETFNAKWEGEYTAVMDAESQKMLKHFYEKLTPKDKADLGFTPEFEKNLLQKISGQG